MKKLGILRLNPVENTLIENLKNELAKIFVNIFSSIEIIPQIIEIPKIYYNEIRKQYKADYLLETTIKVATQYGYDVVLGIIDADIYKSGFNFIFGLAQIRSRPSACIIALARLNPGFYNFKYDEKNSQNIYRLRILKEALHEIGHTLGLPHCINPDCVMIFSNSLLDTDRKPAKFCQSCARRIGLLK